LIEDQTPYRIDGEVGRVQFICHQVTRQGAVILDTSREVFPPLHGKEWYRTIGFKELGTVYGTCSQSYRQAMEELNRIRHQPGATPLRTLQDFVEAEGLAADKAITEEAKRILREGGIEEKTLQPSEEWTACEQRRMDAPRVEEVLRGLTDDPHLLEAMRANPVGYEDPRVTVDVSIDDVLAKKQKAHRKVGELEVVETRSDTAPKAKSTKKEKKLVHTTVAHVQTDGERRIFASASAFITCAVVLAFLLVNKKLRSNWVFFVDGQRTLHDLLLRVFSWQGTLQLILDWPHVVKKCKETLSLALNGRRARNEALKPLLRQLWHGTVDGVIACLGQIDPGQIKSTDAIERLVGYFERNRRYIPCYAARAKLGLRNSSNRGEKANDLVVSMRQKHKGMSWSQDGSTALTALQTLVCNDAHNRWFETGSVDFCLAV